MNERAGPADTAPFWAHSGTAGDWSTWQPLPAHLHAVATGARACGTALRLANTSALAGLFHDLGKYAEPFQRRIRGANIRAEHALAGALVLRAQAQAPAQGERIVAEVLGYAIAGHHAGLPDMRAPVDDGAGGAALRDGFARPVPDLDPAWQAEVSADFTGTFDEILSHIGPEREHWGFDLSLVTRMVFSCLVDADYRDTEAHYARLGEVTPDREWPALAPHLDRHRAALDAHLAGLAQGGDLNALRRDILRAVRHRAVTMPPGLFTLTVPTGGGKTLASLAFALDHAAAQGMRRIIHVIPFTSIIEQTAEVFRAILGVDHVLEHHSAIEEDEAEPRAGRDKIRLAMEDWAAPVVLTTAVQFFESLFAARPSRARKLHNIAGSVIVLDEAQTLPRPLLRPCLRMLDRLARHWGCSIVLCTATQPAVDADRLPGGLALSGRELAPDPVALATRMRRARIVHGGVMEDAALVAALEAHPQALVVVNSRAHARDLFRAAEGLAGVIHLSTRHHARDRQAILAEVRARLRDGRPCRVISTSLIEAGVDVDFPVGWRAEAGLDQCVQTAGRVNREGRRATGDSVLTVFRPADHAPPAEIAGLIGDMRLILARHDDLLHPDALQAYFAQVYWRAETGAISGLDAHGILPLIAMSSGVAEPKTATDFAFRTVAQRFRLITEGMAPVIVPTTPEAEEAVARLAGHESSATLARSLQRHVVPVPPRARAVMLAQGDVAFRHPRERGDQFAVLQNRSLYRSDLGLVWEQAGTLDPLDLLI